jgi:hypothetical protein
MPYLPASPSHLRVKAWRRLQTVGAIALKNSVYVLPRRDDCIETFQWVAREIEALGGQASLCEGQFFDGGTDAEIERRFSEARHADYVALTQEARKLAKSAQAKRVADKRLATLEAQAEKLRRRFEQISSIDFFNAPGREAVEGLMSAIANRLSAWRGETAQPERLEKIARQPRRATWVTRTGVHVDRIACAWLIRRSIDPEAKFKFVPAKGYVPEPGELRFDMFDAEFTHVGDRCTFEVLVERFDIDDPALSAIAELVHDIDLKDEKFGREETAGVRTLIAGICTAHRDDTVRIERGSMMLDDLYAVLAIRRQGKGP